MNDLNITSAPSIDPATIKQISTEPEAAIEWQNLNPIVNAIADAQGVEVGSDDWLAAGPAAWSGQGGAHGSYGWRHNHRVTPGFVRAVIANYGHRRCYYLNAPYRRFGYAAGGRPMMDWRPVDPGDLPNGAVGYVTDSGIVIVSGPDAEHFWLEPLWAVIDSDPVDVPALGATMPSTVLAKALATLLTSSLIGMIRDPLGDGVQPNPWTYGDRANSRILSTIIEAAKRGCLAPHDIETAGLWIRDVCLPFYEKSPGISSFGSAPDGMFSIGLFNGLFWILPVAWDATVLPAPLGDRFMALVERWSQWAFDIEDTVPGRGFNAGKALVNSAALHAGGPLLSIHLLLKPSNVLTDNITYEHWAFRAASIAARMTENDVLIAAAATILDRHKDDPDKRAWLVNADGEYAVKAREVE